MQDPGDAFELAASEAISKSDERVRRSLVNLDHATRKRILQDNAAELYKIPV